VEGMLSVTTALLSTTHSTQYIMDNSSYPGWCLLGIQLAIYI
jgi:hypothetical protein